MSVESVIGPVAKRLKKLFHNRFGIERTPEQFISALIAEVDHEIAIAQRGEELESWFDDPDRRRALLAFVARMDMSKAGGRK